MLLKWCMDFDPVIRYKTMKNIYKIPEIDLENEHSALEKDGLVSRYLSLVDKDTNMWDQGIYNPKWTSTHYTLLELKNLDVPNHNEQYIASSKVLLDKLWFNNGMVRKNRMQDLCVAAMVGSIACHARIQDEKIEQIASYIATHVQSDGGFNCSWPVSDKSSIHTTLTVLIFINDYKRNGYTESSTLLEPLVRDAREYLLERRLFKGLRSNMPILKSSLNIPYPNRYKYDVLKALEYFADCECEYDKRMQDAIDILKSKMNKDGSWPNTNQIQGRTFFKIEENLKRSQINTYRALRVLSHFGVIEIKKPSF